MDLNGDCRHSGSCKTSRSQCAPGRCDDYQERSAGGKGRKDLGDLRSRDRPGRKARTPARSSQAFEALAPSRPKDLSDECSPAGMRPHQSGQRNSTQADMRRCFRTRRPKAEISIWVNKNPYAVAPASDMSSGPGDVSVRKNEQQSNGSPLSDVMDEYEAARLCKVCTKTMRKLRQESKIPYAKVGCRIVYLRAQLYKWLENGGTSAGEEVV